MRDPSGLQPIPLETVTPVITGVSAPLCSSRYSTPRGSFSAMSIEPTQTRPAGSTAASLNLTPSRAGAWAIVRPAQPPSGATARSVSRCPPAVRIPPSRAGNAAETSPSSALIVSPVATRVRCSSPRGMSTQNRESSSERQYGPSPRTAVTSPTGSAVIPVRTCIIETSSRSQGHDTQRLTDVYPVQCAIDRFLPAGIAGRPAVGRPSGLPPPGLVPVGTQFSGVPPEADRQAGGVAGAQRGGLRHHRTADRNAQDVGLQLHAQVVGRDAAVHLQH